MLQVLNLKKSFGDRVLFSQISFTLSHGQKVAIIGRNGCGKSTLMNILSGLQVPDEGQVRWNRGTRIGYLDQHRRFQATTVLQEVCMALPDGYHGLTYRAEQILSGLGVGQGLWPMNPVELSGGYRLRLALAVLLAQEPEVLLLDEPTNYLDLPSVMWLAKFLKNHESAALIISHDRSFLDSVCDTTAGIHQGKFIWVQGGTDAYFEHLLLMQHSQQALKQKLEKHVAKQKQFIERFRAKATKAAQVKSREKHLSKLPKIEEWILAHDLEVNLKAMPRPLDRLIQVNALEFRYREDIPLIGPIDLEWSGVDRLAFVGANGRGKSTLLKLLIGELQPLHGEVQRHSQARIGYFGQRAIESLDTQLTPLQALLQGQENKISEAEARRSLGAFGIEGSSQERSIGSLSGGERSRVVLAKISLEATHGLILDEPTHHLDVETVESLMQALQQYEGAVILVTHSPSTLRAFDPDQLLVFNHDQQIWYRGSYDQWLSQQQEAFAIESSERSKPKSLGAKNYEKQKELKRQHANLERKMLHEQQMADKLTKHLEELYQKLASAHEKQDLQQANMLHHELQLLESTRDKHLEHWFDWAQQIEHIQNEMKELF